VLCHLVLSRTLNNEEAIVPRWAATLLDQKKLIISQDVTIPFLLSEVYEVVNLLRFYAKFFHLQIIWLFMIESLKRKIFVYFLNFYNYHHVVRPTVILTENRT
jgi:hypothetical protein